MQHRAIVVSLSSIAIALFIGGCTSDQAPEEVAPIVIYLARHAEAVYPPPEDSPRDPQLNAMGQDRADALARLLGSESITTVFSTDYHRTRETAEPLAASRGLQVEIYDPTDLPGFAQTLRATPGRHVVLGHSNTTPELAGLLGGDAGEPIDEAMEFDRLYVLTIVGDRATTTVLRYGAPVPPNWREMATTRRPEPEAQPEATPEPQAEQQPQ